MRIAVVSDIHGNLTAADATDEELEAVYGALARPVVVFGHTHRASVRSVAG